MPPNSQEMPKLASASNMNLAISPVASRARRGPQDVPYDGRHKRARRNPAPRSFLKSSIIHPITPYVFCKDGAGNYCIIDSPMSSQENESVKPLASWHLPAPILNYYARKGIERLFDWQAECLSRHGVLSSARNLLYSAPTSAGKTMVADMLMYKTLFERKKKALIILPYVAIALEKVQSLKSVFRSVGIFMDSFAGKNNYRGGFARVDVAVCTIEKASNMINK